jgi:hypothetical protein
MYTAATAQAYVAVGHQAQRRQEMLAELAVSHPRPALPVNLKGQAVDQDRASAVELDVIGAAVF